MENINMIHIDVLTVTFFRFRFLSQEGFYSFESSLNEKSAPYPLGAGRTLNVHN